MIYSAITIMTRFQVDEEVETVAVLVNSIFLYSTNKRLKSIRLEPQTEAYSYSIEKWDVYDTFLTSQYVH